MKSPQIIVSKPNIKELTVNTQEQIPHSNRPMIDFPSPAGSANPTGLARFKTRENI